jgi:ribonuclease Z
MSHLVQARLVNDPFGDPGLFVDFRFGRRALLFDAGDLAGLAPRELLRVGQVFVSHRHMDHFFGLDTLVRASLYRPVTLDVVGPPGVEGGVNAKLAGYAWNLLDGSSVDFSVRVAEFAGGRLGAWTIFRARNRFAPEPAGDAGLPPGLVLEEDDLSIECATLDHSLPCLAFALQERLRVNVWREGLDALGLGVGPWLNQAKRAVRRGEPDETPIELGDGRSVELGLLKHRALHVGPGQRIAYVTDAAFHPGNAEKIIAIARDADRLYIEAAFLDRDADVAAARFHLTARQAGELARRAGAKQLTTFHHSPRYLDQRESPRLEAERAFRTGEPPQPAA